MSASDVGGAAAVPGDAFRFGRYTLDRAGHELRCDGQRVDVQPLVLTLLAFLAAHAERLVTKEELAAAVWKGQDVSDEVIARAVMKARRALGEDAHAPVHLYTEAGRGYRFRGVEATARATAAAADPEAGASPTAPADATVAAVGTPPARAGAQAWRVLPFVNRSEDPSLAWTVTGLQRLLCHAIESGGSGIAVISEPPDRMAADLGSPAGRAVRALARAPGERLVAGEIDETPGGYELSLAWAADGEAVGSLRLEGTALPALVMEAAERLRPASPWQREIAARHPQAWAALHETISHLYRWPRERAAQRLQQRFERLPAHPLLGLQRAELLLQLEAFDEAEAVAQEVGARLDAECPDDLDARLRARVLALEVSRHRGDLTLAAQRVEACQAFVSSHEAYTPAAGDLAKISLATGYLRREAGDFAGARASLERAAVQAARGGLVSRELYLRVWLCESLYALGQTHRAQDLLRQLLARALERDDRIVASTALTVLGGFAGAQGRHSDSARWAERALAVALPDDAKASACQNARALLEQAYVSHGDLTRAAVVWQWRHRDADGSTVTQIGLQETNALRLWREGRLEEALVLYRAILDSGRVDDWLKWATQLRASAAMVLALLGRPDEAEATLAGAAAPALAANTARARAAVCMSAGRRDEARALLQAELPRLEPGRSGTGKLLIDLAWLRLEDGERYDAEDLLDQVVLMDHAPVERQWLELALRDRAEPAEPAAWDALRAGSPSLIRHCAWLGTAEDVQRRRDGRATPLPNLLTVLAW